MMLFSYEVYCIVFLTNSEEICESVHAGVTDLIYVKYEAEYIYI
jgi:hypothetical protein